MAAGNENANATIIGIPYRGDGDGKGLFFDHYTIQTICNTTTVILVKAGEEDAAETTLAEYSRTMTVDMPVGVPEVRTYDPGEQTLPDVGVDACFIAGRCKEVLPEWRLAYEESVIRENCGVVPMVLVCGAVYHFEAVFETTCVAAADHSNTKMVSLNSMGAIVYNTKMHSVKCVSEDWAQRIFGREAVTFGVNSVHTQALSGAPDGFEILFTSTGGPEPTNKGTPRKNRHGRVIAPEERVIEAVISTDAPHVLAIQWHPEAYCTGDHPSQQLLRFGLNPNQMPDE